MNTNYDTLVLETSASVSRRLYRSWDGQIRIVMPLSKPN